MESNFKSRTFIITGATKGIGFATTKRLIAGGHQVIGIARQIPDKSFPGILYTADLSNETATERVFKQINSDHIIDGIVNNVGIAIPQSIDQITLTDFNKVWDINIRPAIQAMQIFKDQMVNKQWGRVVNIASRVALGIENRSTYAAAKAALIAFARSWALELAKTGITVNAVAPGPTETERYRLYRKPGSVEEQRSLSAVPMGRIGKPDEIAAAIEFFLSESAAFITGQTLFVDGGASIGRLML